MKRPKTRPTGAPPSAAKRSKTPPVGEDTDNSEVPDVTSEEGKVLRQVYTLARMRWESMKSGRQTKYIPSSAYNGRGEIKLEGALRVERKRPSEWNKLAKWCEAEDIDGSEYIRYVFSALPHDLSPPEPRQLRSHKYADEWEKVKDKQIDQMRLELNMQQELASGELIVRQKVYEESYLFAARMTIGSGHLALSPLFRYCLARQLADQLQSKKLLKMAGRLEAKAVWQFEQHRSLYKKVWKDILPKGFSARSREFYPELLAIMGV